MPFVHEAAGYLYSALYLLSSGYYIIRYFQTYVFHFSGLGMLSTLDLIARIVNVAVSSIYAMDIG